MTKEHLRQQAASRTRRSSSPKPDPRSPGRGSVMSGSPKCMELLSTTLAGDSWMVSAPLTGALLGEVLVCVTNDDGGRATIGLSLGDVDQLIGALAQVRTEVARIQAHGLEPINGFPEQAS